LLSLAGLRSVGAAGVTVAALTPSVALRVVPNVPEIVTDVDDETDCVLTVNAALVAPAATVTLEGTVPTDVLLLDSVTTAPPDGAALVNVAVPREEVPPVTLVGLSDTADSVGDPDPGDMVRTAPQVVLSSA
jgi:hypothetical protein